MTSAELTALVKKQPIGFACGAVCLVCAGLLYFRSGEIGESQKDYDAKSAESARILANVSNSKNLPEQLAEIQTLAKELDSRLIRAGQLAVNLQFFYKLEAETGVKLIDVRQNNPVKGAKTLFTGIPFSLSVQGSYTQLLAFLHRLEDGSRFCHFTNISLNAGGSPDASVASPSGESMTMTLNLELLGLP